MLGLRRTAPLAPSVMATNIEQIFRDFVMNKIREIEDEGQHSGVSGEGRSNGGVPPSPAKTGPGQEVAAAMECHGDTEETMECAGKPRLEDAGASENAATAEAAPGKEGSETPRKKNKKHKRHKSKKKKKKRKEEKESSSESGVESGGDAQVRAKTQGQSSKERAGEGEEGAAAPDPTGNVPAAGQSMEEGDGKTKKHKRHMAKKKKKKKKKEEEKEKQEKKSPSRSRSESTSASASESDSELKPPSKLPPASSPVFALGKDRESASPIVPSQELQGRMSPVTSVQEVEPVKGNPIYAEVSGEDLTKIGETCLVATEGNEKVTSSVPLEVASKPNDDQGNFSTKQDLPDIIPKLESTHKEEPPAKADADMPADGKENQEAEHEMERKSCSASRSKSRSRSPSKLTSTVPLRTPLQKSRSRSRSQKRSLDKQGSRKARSLSRRRSRSTSKKRSSPRKKRSRSQSGRRRSRSPSLKRSGRKSRSLSTRRRRRSDSRSRTRNRRSRSRSRRRTRSRSIVRRRRSRSRSLSRRRRSRSRSKRSRSRRRTQRSRSARRGRRSRSRSRSRRRRSVSRSRRSRSRSVRRTRRTRSRSIVILRRSRSRSLLRRNRRSGSRSLRRRSRSIKRRRSKSRSLRRSRRSRSRSPARRKRSKTSSPRRSRRSKSRSPTRRRRSRSDSHKGGQKQSQSPKKNRHSKSWSPTRNKSKSRSVSRDVQSCEKSLPPPQEKDASKSGTPAREWCDADLLPAEAQEKSQSPERPGQDDGPSAEVGHQTLNVEGSTVKEETPADPCVDENGTDSTVLASVGAWRPVPFLADSVSLKADPVAEGVNSSPSAEEATVTELPEECKSPKTNPIEKCFTPEMPLTTQDLRSDSPSQATSEPRDPESTEHLASAPEDIEHLTGLRSGSISPQSQSPHESVCVEPEESDVASCEAVKLEPHVTSPDKQRRTRSRSAECDCSEIDRKSERSRSRSVSKEGQAPAEKVDSESRSPSISKKESLSNQGRLSASPGAKKHSTSRSPSRRKKSKSKSPARRKHSRSSSSSRRRRSQSKSASRRKKSKSKSPSRKRKSRSRSRRRKRKSKSPARRRRTRSKSTTKRKKSRSKSMSRSTKRKRSKSRSPVRKKRSKSRSPRRSKRSKSRSPARRKRSKSGEKSKRSKSRSPARKRRSRSRSANRARRSRSRRSRSLSRRRRGGFRSRSFDRRDRWRREPSHSPILILRKKRSASRTRRSTSKTPPRLTELDKDQLLEIAKANAAAMCAKAGMPIPESLRPKAILQLPLPTPVPSPLNLPLPLPMNLSMGMPMGMPNISMNAAMATMTAATMTAALTNMGALGSMPAMPALPSITNKPPPTAMPNTANIEEVKRKVTQKANSISIKELTEKCKMIAESKEEMAVAQPHVSDDEEEEKPFGGGALRENKGISFSLSNPSAKPAARTEAAFAKEFPVSSGSQHRRKENEGVYGEWVPVDKKTDKEKAATSSSAGAVAEEEGKESDSVFPDAPLQPVDITLAVSERAVAQKRLAENPFDVNAICMLSRAQEQVDAWAQSNSIPGLFTGSTGAQVLSSEELSSSGPQAWVKKDQFLKATPVSGGVGEFLMRKMGWRAGEGLGKYREGTVEPIVIDFKTDRKGLVAEGEKMQKSGSLVVMKDLLGKHPVSALMEICNKKKWAPPEFVMVHHSGPDHRKNFLFKVVVNGTDYQPQTASPNKKHAKAMAATVALQAMGEVSGDSLHSGPVFTAATSTG